MEVKTTDLPGIGKKYSMTTVSGKHIVVLLHLTGNREIYYFDDPDDDPLTTVQFSDEESRKLGAILLGVDYQPVADDRMDLLLKSVRIEWLRIEPSSQLLGKTIAESQIRKMTGSTIIGIDRGGIIIGSPDISEVITAGDVLMAIGSREQIKALEDLCR
ncbi:MAG: cation:proton antiporter regulatory subunit [Pseudodesulfovibrio sp.]|uniref:TrkA-C domain protein n=1 Tax=Pseudodesulfovibrio aespoeensis (strain ATCC 700646 / DSM 10631 / Aspo-2) TaxID=643562 RepID=E6VYQ2_PSEA9|nr:MULTISPECIES: TrkA C-terminal domain-containing protein [Pseudodesulfovibrio]MBU4190797.1 potassium transporter TrkA [Pseudomonadota bacterium]ADU63919.1 TrkA-C domain protein [Pseudodesulfovibrio aespoeensis Aspo-2]MBU4377670.1 potassium transporter TrkA [Pseudomonadota bacterium]MBU4475414.1 potassium transporter TrkA [Pseudomonadota bacterium]MBU4517356.1 potassium transporter TrkA [Pseudomonadota bacterium]